MELTRDELIKLAKTTKEPQCPNCYLGYDDNGKPIYYRLTLINFNTFECGLCKYKRKGTPAEIFKYMEAL